MTKYLLEVNQTKSLFYGTFDQYLYTRRLLVLFHPPCITINKKNSWVYLIRLEHGISTVYLIKPGVAPVIRNNWDSDRILNV